MAVPGKLSKHLDGHGVVYEPIRHRTVFTAYDLAQTLRHDLSDIVKTLLVKTEQGMRLVVVPASKRLDLGKLKKVLGVKKLSIATEQDMQRTYQVKPGAIHAFGTLLQKTPVVVDRTLTKAKQIILPTGSFTDSIRMKVREYMKLENPLVAAFTEASGLKLTARTPKKRPHKKGKGRPKLQKKTARKKTAKKKTVRRAASKKARPRR